MVRVISIVFLMLIMVGCSFPSFPYTLEEEATAFIQGLDSQSSQLQQIEADPQPVIHGKRDEREGSIILYSKSYPNDRRQFGYVWIEADGIFWRGKQATYKEVHLQGIKSNLQLAYDMHAIWQSSGNVAIVFGASLHPAVHSVEVTFATGETKRDTLTQGMFAIMGPNISGPDIIHEVYSSVLEIRALDVQGQVLQRFPSP
jgi:hypothetical protein